MGRRGEGAAVPEGRAFGKRRPKPVMKRKDEEEKGAGVVKKGLNVRRRGWGRRCGRWTGVRGAGGRRRGVQPGGCAEGQQSGDRRHSDKGGRTSLLRGALRAPWGGKESFCTFYLHSL